MVASVAAAIRRGIERNDLLVARQTLDTFRQLQSFQVVRVQHGLPSMRYNDSALVHFGQEIGGDARVEDLVGFGQEHVLEAIRGGARGTQVRCRIRAAAGQGILESH